VPTQTLIAHLLEHYTGAEAHPWKWNSQHKLQVRLSQAEFSQFEYKQRHLKNWALKSGNLKCKMAVPSDAYIYVHSESGGIIHEMYHFKDVKNDEIS
jgi:hypothetical protein